MDGYPDSMGTAAPPPPPPPPPVPARPGAPWWAIVVMAAAAAVVVAAIVIAVGRQGPTTTVAASSTSTTNAGTTSSTAPPTTTLATTTTTQPATTSSTSTTSTSTTLPSRLYGPAALEYFQELAGGAEFGGSTGTLHRWAADLRIAIYGNPTDRDRRALEAVVAELNDILDTVELTLAQDDPNVEIHFVPVDDFPSLEPNYVEGNRGFVYIWWDADGAVYRGRVLISTTGVTPAERAHLIREEITQSLGLLNDSWLYPDSIFYQGWTDTTRYTRLDRLVIEMLYRPELSPGMSIDEAVAILAMLEN